MEGATRTFTVEWMTTRPGTPHDKHTKQRAYLVGGSIGSRWRKHRASLATAAFMICDGGFAGENISILEAEPIMGGSLDSGGDPERGYSLRGGRMLTTDNYECSWDLFKSIPSLYNAGQTVFDETVAFNERHKAHSMARLVDKRRAMAPVTSMGFSIQDRIELPKLSKSRRRCYGSKQADVHRPGASATLSQLACRSAGVLRYALYPD